MGTTPHKISEDIAKMGEKIPKKCQNSFSHSILHFARHLKAPSEKKIARRFAVPPLENDHKKR